MLIIQFLFISLKQLKALILSTIVKLKTCTQLKNHNKFLLSLYLQVLGYLKMI
jgi:hypothetical protein